MLTIEELQARIDRIDERLESWSDKPQTDERIAKIERQESRRSRYERKIAALEEREAAAIERAEPLIDPVTGEELPKDSFTFRVEELNGVVSVLVDIYDSPFDDTFVGGQPLWLKAGASGKPTRNGTMSSTTSGTLANGEYWDGLNRQTVGMGSSAWNDWPEFSHLALTLSKDSEFTSIVETADYTMAELFG